ncbi:MAG: hypothetical protein ACRCWJ_23780, partial [Casimicrobium sp.]
MAAIGEVSDKLNGGGIGKLFPELEGQGVSNLLSAQRSSSGVTPLVGDGAPTLYANGLIRNTTNDRDKKDPNNSPESYLN